MVFSSPPLFGGEVAAYRALGHLYSTFYFELANSAYQTRPLLQTLETRPIQLIMHNTKN